MNKKCLKNDNLYQKQCIFLSSPWRLVVGYTNPVKPEVRGQKEKKKLFYTISLVDVSVKGEQTENPTLADFYFRFSSGLDLLSTYIRT